MHPIRRRLPLSHRALAAIGLMLLPDERDALHLQRTPKDAALETRVHEQIAQLVPSFEVRVLCPFIYPPAERMLRG